MKLLHTADWQIGSQFGQFTPEEAAHLTEARFETVRRIAAFATTHQVDAVIVAGDVFDQQTVSETVIRRLFAALSGYRGPWYLLPGNHDAALIESVWTRAQRLAGVAGVATNVHLLLTPGVTLMPSLNAALLHAPLTQRQTYEDTTAFFDAVETPPGYLRIGLAHGSVTGILQEGIDSTNPIAADRVETARLDYLALGDWHGLYRVNARTYYSGTHEQDRFRGNDPGHILEVELTEVGSEPLVRASRIGRYRWTALRPRFEVGSDVVQWRQQLAAFGADDIVRIDASGSLSLADAEQFNTLIEETRARVRALRVHSSGIHIVPTDDDLAEIDARGGYLAAVVARLRALQQETMHQDADRSAIASEALLLLARYQRVQRAGDAA